MKIQHLAATAAFLGLTYTANAQVVNMALQLEPGAYVNCGSMPQLDELSSYTIQFWYNQNSASQSGNAVLLQRGTAENDKFVVSLTNGRPVFSIGDKNLIGGPEVVTPGEWHQVTLVADNGEAKLFFDGNLSSSSYLGSIPASEGNFFIGGGSFDGRVDDIRLWNEVLIPDYDYYVNTTLNEFNPQVDNLIAYYKFDQADCKDVVEYASIWRRDSSEAYNNHGIMSNNGVSKVEVTDNPKLPYLINSAYTANERFWDRYVSAGQYLISNDVIILGIQSYPDGHLKPVTPNAHGTLTNAEYLETHEGRNGVLHFKGEGAKMVTHPDGFEPDENGVYTFLTWLYIDEWNEGSYIVKKEIEDGTKGFSIRLGKEEDKTIIVTIDGNEYARKSSVFVKGKWIHLAITPNTSASQGNRSIYFVVNGSTAYPTTASEVVCPSPSAVDCDVVYGENFSGMLDETAMWSTALPTTDIKLYKDEGYPMPGVEKIITADRMWQAKSLYLYDQPSQPGWDYYSQDNWREIIRDIYKGYTGYNIRISVKSHNNWLNNLYDAKKRKIFAEDLAKLSEGYDGVELDLEWEYGTQTVMGYLSDEISAVLPEGKIFMISTHNVAYGFPVGKMKNVDAFTFQQYGPQSNHFLFSHFKNMCQNFVNYGYPREKILTSYSTTTSEGFNANGQRISPIKGVKDGFITEDYIPSINEEKMTMSDGYTYWFTGPLQTYHRAKYTVENNFGGIFYWDMGNDMPFASPYNLAKHSSYALCGNVDPYVEKVEINHRNSTGINSPVLDQGINSTKISVRIEDNVLKADFLSGETVETIDIYAVNGVKLFGGNYDNSGISICHLPTGMYMVQARGSQGTVAASKIMKK